MPGLVDGKLEAPPSSPNCVSSQADPSDSGHHIAPLPLGDVATWQERVKAALASLPRTEVVTEEDGYLHATQTTRLFRWVDDVEFVPDVEAGVLHVRSASRTGYGDFNVNRKRVESLRSLLA